MNIGEKIAGERAGAGRFYPAEPILLFFDINQVYQYDKTNEADAGADHCPGRSGPYF